MGMTQFHNKCLHLNWVSLAIGDSARGLCTSFLSKSYWTSLMSFRAAVVQGHRRWSVSSVSMLHV